MVLQRKLFYFLGGGGVAGDGTVHTAFSIRMQKAVWYMAGAARVCKDVSKDSHRGAFELLHQLTILLLQLLIQVLNLLLLRLQLLLQLLRNSLRESTSEMHILLRPHMKLISEAQTGSHQQLQPQQLLVVI